MKYISNPELPIVKSGYLGNRIENGRFTEYVSTPKTLKDIIRWKREPNHKDPDYVLPVMQDGAFLERDDDYIVWLGHATFLIQIDGKRIITDPCLTSPPFVKRHTPLPVPIDEIKPDYILISHGHYDHLDARTLKSFSGATALVPLKMTKIIERINPFITTQEAGWYQRYNIDEGFKIYLLPALHWHKRTPWDTNKVLWGSFLIETPSRTIYFAADTAYGEHFADIGRLFEIDIALLPIGAYEPEWFMGDNHISPHDALRAFDDLRAKTMVPMHYGTFDLASEPLGKPERVIRELSDSDRMKMLVIGEVWGLDEG